MACDLSALTTALSRKASVIGLSVGLGLLAVPATATLNAAWADDQVVNIYNWSDYIAEDTLEKFTAETGIKVVYDVFDSNEVLEGKMMAGRSGYDIIVPTGNFLKRMIDAGIIGPLDKDKLSNYGNLDASVMERAAAHDPGGDHAVVYMWGTNGLGVNVGKVKELLGEDAPMDSYALLFDPQYASKLGECGIHVLDSPSEVFEVALNYLGKDPASTNADDLKAAAELWSGVRPHIQKFHSSEYINALANGDICLALGYSGDVFQAQARAEEAENGVEVGYIIPKEGTIMWFDMMAIPADAPNRDNAHAFIDFIMKPEIAADITNYVWYANANAASTPMIDEEVRTNPEIYPSAEVMERLFPEKEVDAKTERQRTRLWNQVKTGI
ncbi:MAG: polyamine ABC transporter substrate-binding protein [Rhodospirillaceae bacterium]